MFSWNDAFTGVRYNFSEGWKNKVRKHLVEELRDKLNYVSSVQHAADCLAQFWWDYYGLVFPLRFGVQFGREIDGGLLFENTSNGIDLESYLDRPLRGKSSGSKPLDCENLPPLLPAHGEEELISDHSLVATALVNISLRRNGFHESDPDTFHQVRLGVLLHELVEGADTVANGLIRRNFPKAWQSAQFLIGKVQQLPEGIDEKLLRKVHDGETITDEDEVTIVVGAVQRIKQFVFETPGLNEVRGASTLLDDLIGSLRKTVHEEIGPEVILRSAGSVIEFLAPFETDANGKAWTNKIREHFFQFSGSSFITAGAKKVKVRQLLTDFQKAIGQVYRAVQQNRNEANLPTFETLPFEERCFLCKSRPADGWFWHPDKIARPGCRVCITKREIGQKEKQKAEEVLKDIGINAEQVGVKSKDIVADDLEKLMPKGLRRKLLSVIYGDGNNFGDIVGRINSIAMNLQWTNRVEKTARTAAGIALARATKESADERDEPLDKLPFQVLALGGDDISLITWGRIGLRFCERFLALTDMEFQQGTGKKLSEKPVSFSLGMLFTDEKSPVRRTVEFAEEELMKWAKRAARTEQKIGGNVAFLLAMTAEQIPADLEAYREKMFLCGRDGFQLSLTLRPFTAKELEFLLRKVKRLREKGYQGQLNHIVSGFIEENPMSAMLYYVYQKGRKEGEEIFEIIEQPSEEWGSIFGSLPLPAAPIEGRRLFGEKGKEGIVYFSPLWDLLEMIKIMG